MPASPLPALPLTLPLPALFLLPVLPLTLPLPALPVTHPGPRVCASRVATSLNLGPRAELCVGPWSHLQGTQLGPAHHIRSVCKVLKHTKAHAHIRHYNYLDKCLYAGSHLQALQGKCS